MIKILEMMFNCLFVILDMDGTLLDSMKEYYKIIGHLLEKKFDIDSNEAAKFFRSTPVKGLGEQFRIILESHNKDFDDFIIAELEKEFFQQGENLTPKAFPGAKELLQQLREEGKKIFLSTDAPTERAIRNLKDNELHNFFDAILGREPRKKGVEHLKIFADSCGLSLKEFCSKAVIIGDGIKDMSIAKEHEIDSIGMSTTFEVNALLAAGADAIVVSLEELVEIISS